MNDILLPEQLKYPQIQNLQEIFHKKLKEGFAPASSASSKTFGLPSDSAIKSQAPIASYLDHSLKFEAFRSKVQEASEKLNALNTWSRFWVILAYLFFPFYRAFHREYCLAYTESQQASYQAFQQMQRFEEALLGQFDDLLQRAIIAPQHPLDPQALSIFAQELDFFYDLYPEHTPMGAYFRVMIDAKMAHGMHWNRLSYPQNFSEKSYQSVLDQAFSEHHSLGFLLEKSFVLNNQNQADVLNTLVSGPMTIPIIKNLIAFISRIRPSPKEYSWYPPSAAISPLHDGDPLNLSGSTQGADSFDLGRTFSETYQNVDEENFSRIISASDSSSLRNPEEIFLWSIAGHSMSGENVTQLISRLQNVPWQIMTNPQAGAELKLYAWIMIEEMENLHHRMHTAKYSSTSKLKSDLYQAFHGFNDLKRLSLLFLFKKQTLKEHFSQYLKLSECFSHRTFSHAMTLSRAVPSGDAFLDTLPQMFSTFTDLRSIRRNAALKESDLLLRYQNHQNTLDNLFKEPEGFKPEIFLTTLLTLRSIIGKMTQPPLTFDQVLDQRIDQLNRLKLKSFCSQAANNTSHEALPQNLYVRILAYLLDVTPRSPWQEDFDQSSETVVPGSYLDFLKIRYHHPQPIFLATSDLPEHKQMLERVIHRALNGDPSVQMYLLAAYLPRLTSIELKPDDHDPTILRNTMRESTDGFLETFSRIFKEKEKDGDAHTLFASWMVQGLRLRNPLADGYYQQIKERIEECFKDADLQKIVMEHYPTAHPLRKNILKADAKGLVDYTSIYSRCILEKQRRLASQFVSRITERMGQHARLQHYVILLRSYFAIAAEHSARQSQKTLPPLFKAFTQTPTSRIPLSARGPAPKRASLVLKKEHAQDDSSLELHRSHLLLSFSTLLTENPSREAIIDPPTFEESMPQALTPVSLEARSKISWADDVPPPPASSPLPEDASFGTAFTPPVLIDETSEAVARALEEEEDVVRWSSEDSAEIASSHPHASPNLVAYPSASSLEIISEEDEDDEDDLVDDEPSLVCASASAVDPIISILNNAAIQEAMLQHYPPNHMIRKTIVTGDTPAQAYAFFFQHVNNRNTLKTAQSFLEKLMIVCPESDRPVLKKHFDQEVSDAQARLLTRTQTPVVPALNLHGTIAAAAASQGISPKAPISTTATENAAALAPAAHSP